MASYLLGIGYEFYDFSGGSDSVAAFRVAACSRGKIKVLPEDAIAGLFDHVTVRPDCRPNVWLKFTDGLPALVRAGWKTKAAEYDINKKFKIDVLTVVQIAQVTGYSIKAVSRWCSEGRLKSIIKQPKFMVPKVWLLDFLTSNDYNNICRKSGKHYAMIQAIKEIK